ncbi:peptidoglycan-binding protein [Desulfosporosinus sp.]|uniref:peptidoglycan-binding domain-containing protein n=1 Tax=Desulfosporosinus sp. TaxID=157907 RepID=UPI0025C34685|nr:peptidoglycan-binding protein [Desulfosporosinus sp.]
MHNNINSQCPLLKMGSSGASVKKLQSKLAAAGFSPGGIDGIFGSKTRAAVVAFQKSQGLAQDGIVGTKTWTALGVNCHTPTPPPGNQCPTLRQGSTGPAVVDLQGRLKTRGFYTGNIDGIFGPLTRSAVVAFQGSMGLAQDGIVGIKTWTALGVNCYTPTPPPPVNHCPTLQQGSTGPAVVHLQELLKSRGFYTGNIDGIFGPLTRSAVVAFQGSMGLVQDGIVGIKTWTALGVDCHTPTPPPVNHCPTLQEGSTGPAVVNLQELLRARGFYTGNIDGIFGPLTRSAVVAFQGSMGLVQDGIVGIKTWTALGVDCYTPTPPPVNHCPTLQEGSTGPAVVNLQELLRVRGFYTGNIDGIFGPLTRSAVVAFQGSMGLVQDGIVGIKTWTALGVDCYTPTPPPVNHCPTLQEGSTGPAVVNLQELLRIRGYYAGNIDGIFGPITRSAVVHFQGCMCLVQDGIVGIKTWTALGVNCF